MYRLESHLTIKRCDCERLSLELLFGLHPLITLLWSQEVLEVAPQPNKTDSASSTTNLGTSLIESIWSSGGKDIIIEAADLALDSVLNEGVLEKIPVFGWLVKGYGVVTTIQDRLFLKKVALFLQGSSEVTEDERHQFRERMVSDPSYCRNVGETLVLLLNRQEDFEKAFILGKAFAGYEKGIIQYETFLRLAAAIDKAFIGDLRNLELYYSKINTYDAKLGKPFSEFLDDATCQSLYNIGLVRSDGYVEDTYHPNELGSTLIRLLKE